LLGDQLADYLAAARAGQVRLSGYVLPTPFRRTCLLFVTADASMPRKSIEESIASLRCQHNQDSDSAFYWLSWRSAWKVLEEALSIEPDAYRLRLLGDLRSLLEKKRLRPFLGFGRMSALVPELPSTPRWRTRWAIRPFTLPAARRFFSAGIFDGLRPPAHPHVGSWRMRRWALSAPIIPTAESVDLAFGGERHRFWTRVVPPPIPGPLASGKGGRFHFSRNSASARAS
jgi:hypothetical protein